MKDENQNILYVGKAKVLKNRVRSYFHGTHNNKTTRLVSHIRDFEFIVTGSEKEALLLEINLIKKQQLTTALQSECGSFYDRKSIYL